MDQTRGWNSFKMLKRCVSVVANLIHSELDNPPLSCNVSVNASFVLAENPTLGGVKSAYDWLWILVGCKLAVRVENDYCWRIRPNYAVGWKLVVIKVVFPSTLVACYLKTKCSTQLSCSENQPSLFNDNNIWQNDKTAAIQWILTCGHSATFSRKPSGVEKSYIAIHCYYIFV